MSQRDQLARLIESAEAGLRSADPGLRRLAVAAAAADPGLHEELTRMLGSDPDDGVRRECAESLGRGPAKPIGALHEALRDHSAEVREAAATALGEVAGAESVERLIDAATRTDEDKLVREAAVAALGAIGDTRALPVLLDLIAGGPPQIRRRCVPALSVFDGDEVADALRAAAADRNPMVREAAEMVVGRNAQ